MRVVTLTLNDIQINSINNKTNNTSVIKKVTTSLFIGVEFATLNVIISPNNMNSGLTNNYEALEASAENKITSINMPVPEIIHYNGGKEDKPQYFRNNLLTDTEVINVNDKEFGAMQSDIKSLTKNMDKLNEKLDKMPTKNWVTNTLHEEELKRIKEHSNTVHWVIGSIVMGIASIIVSIIFH